MGIVLVVLHVIICFILIAVILLQAGRGQGFTGSSFGGGVQSILGTRTSDFLTKATTISAILFLFTCIGLDILEAHRNRSLFETKEPTAPVDLQQIQKVLEKIKTEDQQSSPSAVQALNTETPAVPAPSLPAAPSPTIEEKTAGEQNGGT